jgi:hypothetical protein
VESVRSIRITKPDGSSRVIENASAAIIDRLPADWKWSYIEEVHPCFERKETVVSCTPAVYTVTVVDKVKFTSALLGFTYDEIMQHFARIREQHFAHVAPASLSVNIKGHNILGRAYTKRRHIALSKRFLRERDERKLLWTIFHEYCHIEFPGQGHTGAGFRTKEFGNPFRLNKSSALRFIS